MQRNRVILNKMTTAFDQAMIQRQAEKPTCKLTGTNGNVFALLGRVTSTLKKAGQPDKAREVAEKLLGCSSYDAALRLLMEYVDVK